MAISSPAFDPNYPTPAALAFRDGFLAGARTRGLSGIPDQTLSWAIDRALQAQATSVQAGKAFAECYYRVQMKPDYQDAQRRNGILKREAFLLSEYEKELRNGI